MPVLCIPLLLFVYIVEVYEFSSITKHLEIMYHTLRN
jgi:hypothetical protein